MDQPREPFSKRNRHPWKGLLRICREIKHAGEKNQESEGKENGSYTEDRFRIGCYAGDFRSPCDMSQGMRFAFRESFFLIHFSEFFLDFGKLIGNLIDV